ncbi:AF4/FMR2 family member 4 [Orchesella cincta]|uniref:AF4/FMR2 family member lilli n=1 Tax=Orchesella cincta TaxID=48709 RepID=A0A1D2N4M4_ORCCI|nr:AF4/FMR2 family member 4 [Orchesella cincta]
MLKEMMDVTAPLTAIQTPVKETNTKKFTQRRTFVLIMYRFLIRSIRDSGMADVPSPVQRMDSSDSSSSYESETSDSESEDSSSGSQTGGDKIDPVIPKITPNTNSPTRWNLGSFIRKNDYRGTPNDANTTTTLGGSKSPKDTKPNAHQVNAINSETSPGDVPVKTESVVSSTSLFNKAQSLSPLDTPIAVPPVTRKSTRSTAEVKPEPYVPPKPPPPIANNVKTPNSTNNPVNKSLSSSSSEDDAEKLKKEASRAAAAAEQEKAANATGAGKRKRKRSSSSAERIAQKSGEESSPENKNKKNIQDRNKNDTIRRLFLSRKLDSPTRGDSSDLGKSPSSGAPSTNGNGASNSTSASTAPSGAPVPSVAVGAAGGSTSNRVQAKDNGKKNKDNATVSNNVHNGELDASATSAGASVTETVSKKRDDSTKEKESASSRASHGKKNQKSAGSASGSASTSKASSNPYASVLLPPPPPPAAKIKEEVPGKADKSLSSLVVKINLSKLKRKPNMMPAPPPPPPLAPPPPPVVLKIEKDTISEKGAKTIKEPPAAPSNNADLFLKRVHHNSSRVGSSSDHAKDAKETAVVTHNPPPGRVPPDGSLCSDIDIRAKKRSKSKKVKSSSPKKTKTKHEPDSHSKVRSQRVEEDTACGEVSSNVIGFASCDSVSVSTTRTPPVESDVVQAPDSSLNPPHLPSPVVPPQPVYFSYFEKSDHLAAEDYYSRYVLVSHIKLVCETISYYSSQHAPRRPGVGDGSLTSCLFFFVSRDQDSYLEEAKRLKHKADGERVSTTQASVYLEAGLYFILTGISMERDRTVGSTAAFTMYKDTLVLIRYIGSRFGRSRGGAEYSNPIEAKIIVLSMRCQSMLSLKLFKIKMRETKEMVQYLQDHFQRHPTIDLPPIASSPQLSTPSPHSPTSSPAASSSLHPSPHHPNQIMTSIPRSLYSNMQKTCSSTMHLISAHELWEAADQMVEKYRIEDFFVQLDRTLGPLTLHNTLVDLVRYVKHALQILKSTSELS